MRLGKLIAAQRTDSTAGIPCAMIDLAYRILPGFGVFGPTAHLHKSFLVETNLRRIELYLDVPEPRSYTFPQLTLVGRKGKQIPLREIVDTVALTSQPDASSSDQLRNNLLTGKGIQAVKEMRPSLTIQLKKAVYISELRLANRRNHPGRASRHLALRGYANGQLVFAARNFDPKQLLDALNAICIQIGVPLPSGQVTQAELQNLVERIRAAIIARLDQPGIRFDPITLLSFLPLYGHKGPLSHYEIRIAAEAMIQILGNDRRARTIAFDPLGILLSSSQKLQTVMVEVNRLLTQRTQQPITIVASKHFIQEPRLVREKARYLKMLDAVFPILRDCGVTPVLCYGSLLGAVRENSFLAHDDDVDILYHDGSTSREEMLKRRYDLAKALTARGYICELSDKAINFLIRGPHGPVDLFPCWESEGQINVLMGYEMFRPVDREVVLPTSTVHLHDKPYPSPAQPEKFLQARYGKGWRVSDPYYEWPWPITHETT